MADGIEHPGSGAPYVFVSYARADRERVLPVVAALHAAGVPVWLDQHDIAGAANYALLIADAIEHCAAFVLMCSAASLASRNVKQEVALAWKYARPYLPLLLEVVTIPKDVEYFLETAQWIELLDTPERHWLPRVLAALKPFGITPVARDELAPLAGRERELALLRERVTAARAGHGGLVLIGGEAGIGKTTLAEVILRDAATEGALVLTGHCYDLAETPPYGPWIDLFLRFPTTPEMPPLPPAFAVRGTVGAVPSQMALFAQVQDFLIALAAARPLVVLLDDLHWADPASLDLLRFLARSLADVPLLILATYRVDELTRRHPLTPLLGTLAREAKATRIDLHSLGQTDVGTLVTRRYALPERETTTLVAYLTERTEGNPFFVGELLRALEESEVLARDDDSWRLGNLGAAGMPSLLRQVIEGRLARLDVEAQRLLAVAAVIGQEVPLVVWAAVAEVDEEALLDVIEPGVEAHLLAELPDGSGVRFVHALIREALYEGVLATRRRRIHRQVGEALLALGDPDLDAVAYHLRQAGDARAAAWLVTAGERAQRAYAWLTAAERYEAAIALLPEIGPEAAERGWLLYRVSRLRRFEDTERSVRYLDETLQVAETSGDRALAALALFTRGVVRYSALREFVGGYADEMAGAAAIEALSPVERERIRPYEPTIAALPRAALLLPFSATGRYHEHLIITTEVMAQSSSEDDPATGIVPGGRNTAGSIYQPLGRVAETHDMQRQVLDRLRAMRNFHRLGQVINFAQGWMLVYDTDRVEERRRLAAEGEEAISRATGVGFNLPPGLVSLPMLVIEGRWEEARPIALAALAERREFYHMASARSRALLVQAQGESEIAWRIVEDAVPGGPTSEPGILPFLYAQEGQRLAVALCLDAGEMAQARAWLEAHDRWLAWSGAVYGQADGQALWARYYRQAGDAAEAYLHAQQALALATEPRQPLALIAAHRLLDALATDAGRFVDAETHLHASLALADACAAPYERALTLLRMAELRAATGESDAARTLLDEVRAICTPLGAQPALARVDTLAEKIATDNR